jgi:DNA-binding transcriptional LysR family regulator
VDNRSRVRTHEENIRMEIRHLRYFVVIAEERSFTRAAERLFVAQPGLSTQIRQLEVQLGVRLFDRHPRGVSLTTAGDLFLERARAVLSAMDVASATGRDLQAGIVGTLRLGIATEARWCRTPDILGRFARERRGVELTVVEGYGGTLSRDVLGGRLDALIAPAVAAPADLRGLNLGFEPWVVIMSRRHRLAGDGPLPADRLNGEPIVVTAHRDGAGYDRAVAQTLAESGVTISRARGAPGPALHAAVRDGEAVALTTAPGTDHPDVISRPLEPCRTLGFELLWHAPICVPALAEFVDVVSDLIQQPTTRRPLAAVA